MRISFVIKGILAAAAVAVPALCNADSSFQTGAGPLTATAHIDFQVTIPKVLSLQVGTAASIDKLTFAPAAAVVGNGTAVAGLGGDQGGSVESASVVSNGGTVTFSSQTTGPLSNGAGDTVSYAQIGVVAATKTTATVLVSPTLVDGGTTTVSLTPVGKVVNQDALWTFSYKNTVVPAPGTYGGTNTNGSRVTYTASVL